MDVTVTTPGGTSSTGAADEFTYLAPLPSIRRVEPSRGAVSGGTPVTILGDQLGGLVSVDFGTTAALGTNVVSNHEVTATAPPGSGTVDITVTTTAGTSQITSNDQFTYGFPLPTVTRVSPPKGGSLGGARVRIAGSGLSGATAVYFGSTAASRFKVSSDTSITASAPPGTGTVDVTVTTPYGTSSVTSADEFTYVIHPPVVDSVLPNSGLPTGGTAVVISGANFREVSAVDFGGVAALSFEVVSSGSISASAPPGSGTVDITITTPVGTSATNSSDQFTYG